MVHRSPACGARSRGWRARIIRTGSAPADAPSSARLRAIYTIAATIAGLAGGLLAQTTQFVSLGALSFERSAELVTILVIGGTGRLYGGVIGAIVYLVARDRLSGINPQYWYFWIGLMLIGVVLFLPNGVLGGLATMTAYANERWRKS